MLSTAQFKEKELLEYIYQNDADVFENIFTKVYPEILLPVQVAQFWKSEPVAAIFA